MDDLAAQPKRGPEQSGGRADVAGQHERSDVAGGDHLAVDLDQVDHAGLKPPSAASSAGSPAAPCPKRKFSPTDDVRGAEPADEHLDR